MGLVVSDAFRNADTLAVVLFVNSCAGDSRINASPAVFLF